MIDFVVIKTLKADAEKVKDDIDEQFCNEKNPLSGVRCLLKNKGEHSFIFVPMRLPPGMPRIVLKLVIKGLKSSLKGFAVEVLDIKKTPYKREDLAGEYDEEIEKLVS